MILIVDSICNFLTNKIRKENPEIDDERAEIINYGIQLIVGEIPKLFIMIGIAFILGIGPLTILTFLIMMPYRAFSGGFHLKTHIGCTIGTPLVYCGIAFLSQNIVIETNYIKYLLMLGIWIFGIIMVSLYAPADTENIPILSKKERKQKKIMSYITLTVTIAVGVIIQDRVISNIILLGMLVQSICISKLAYRLTNNKYGYEVYN